MTVMKGVPHGFRRFGDRLSASSKWDALCLEGIRWLLSSNTTEEFRIDES